MNYLPPDLRWVAACKFRLTITQVAKKMHSKKCAHTQHSTALEVHLSSSALEVPNGTVHTAEET